MSANAEPFPLDRIPAPGSKNVTLRVDRSAERNLRKRHPWLFAQGIREQSHPGTTGDFAVVFDRKRQFLAIGLYDPHSEIRVRVLHSGSPNPLDDAFFDGRLARCAKKRERLVAAGTTGYRLVHGENEGMPGFVVDRYADSLVVKLYTPAWLPHLARMVPSLLRTRPAERVILRLSRESRERVDELHGLEDGALIHGSQASGPVVFEENRLRFECDVRRGQKTGFFLDQRENRERVERLARDLTGEKEVLNVFSYSGGFSLYAARGGARHVISLDQSRPALEAAQRNFDLNAERREIARAHHETICADAFTSLNEMRHAGRLFDMVVIDPPSFAKNRAEAPKAIAAYERLARLGLSVLKRQGFFVMASCSTRVSEDDFFRAVARAAGHARVRLHELERSAHAIDHPIGFAHGAYLKCLFAKKI